MSPAEIKALATEAGVTDISTAARVYGISRSFAYELAARGELPFPVVRVGRRYVVPVASLLALLGIDPTGE